MMLARHPLARTVPSMSEWRLDAIEDGPSRHLVEHIVREMRAGSECPECGAGMVYQAGEVVINLIPAAPFSWQVCACGYTE